MITQKEYEGIARYIGDFSCGCMGATAEGLKKDLKKGNYIK